MAVPRTLSLDAESAPHKAAAAAMAGPPSAGAERLTFSRVQLQAALAQGSQQLDATLSLKQAGPSTPYLRPIITQSHSDNMMDWDPSDSFARSNSSASSFTASSSSNMGARNGYLSQSDFSSASSIASSQTEYMDEEAELPPPLSRSCGSIKSLELQTPAKELPRHSPKLGGDYSLQPIPTFDKTYSFDNTIRESYRSTSPPSSSRNQSGSSTQDEPSSSQHQHSSSSGSESSTTRIARSAATGDFGRTLGLTLTQSPSSSPQLAQAAPPTFATPAPRVSQGLTRTQRLSLALSPLKISPSASRPSQPQTLAGPSSRTRATAQRPARCGVPLSLLRHCARCRGSTAASPLLVTRRHVFSPLRLPASTRYDLHPHTAARSAPSRPSLPTRFPSRIQ